MATHADLHRCCVPLHVSAPIRYVDGKYYISGAFFRYVSRLFYSFYLNGMSPKKKNYARAASRLSDILSPLNRNAKICRVLHVYHVIICIPHFHFLHFLAHIFFCRIISRRFPNIFPPGRAKTRVTISQVLQFLFIDVIDVRASVSSLSLG